MPYLIDTVALTHTTHLENLPLILRDGGVRCPDGRDAAYREIWSAEIVERRARQVVDAASGLRLGGCVGLTMTPKTPAAFAVATGYGVPRVPNRQIVHLETDLVAVTDHLFGVADRNPLARDALIIAGTLGFDRVDWEVIGSGNFAKAAHDPTRPTRAAAEALIRELLPISAVQRILCWSTAVAQAVTGAFCAGGMRIEVEVRPAAYFSAGA